MTIRHNSGVVAIVDDESVQSALQDLIELDGLSTFCFGSAEQFLDSEARHKAVCLIADIRVPGMSGLELQAKLKAERCRLPISFITAHGDDEMGIHVMHEGAPEFSTKPFNAAALLEMVHPTLERRVTEQTHNPACGNDEKRCATRDDILKIFSEGLNGL